ncbi:MAG: hypothetical protein GY813_11235 [Halieaceae bacterium]|nr:hypothetical protein [Halieaceae bacterium]
MTSGSHSYFHRGDDSGLLGSTIAEQFLGIVERFPEWEAIDCRLTSGKIHYAS